MNLSSDMIYCKYGIAFKMIMRTFIAFTKQGYIQKATGEKQYAVQPIQNL